MKSEPQTWSWCEQIAAGEKSVEWDGVRNYQARNNIKAMRLGDEAFFYHSGKERQIMGVVKVVSDPHIDSTDSSKQWWSVDFMMVSSFVTPVTLADIKCSPMLEGMEIVKYSRLSVQKILPEEWLFVIEMSR